MLKNIALSAALVATAFAAQAQDEEFKAKSGSNTFEVSYNPTGATLLSSPIGASYLRYRRFIADQTAIRLGLNIGLNSTSDESGSGASVTKTTTSQFMFDLRPGIEKHFAGTNRLSPYVGGELIFGMKSASGKVEGGGTTDEIDGATGAGATGFDNRGYTRFGLGGLIGADFYFVPAVYLGIEAGLSFNVDTQADVTVKSAGAEVKTKGGTVTSLGYSPTAGLRLGFRF